MYLTISGMNFILKTHCCNVTLLPSPLPPPPSPLPPPPLPSSPQVEEVDATFQRWFSQCACGCLPPLATAVGGVVAQEALIALTGKFSPLQQWVGGWVHRDSCGLFILSLLLCFLLTFSDFLLSILLFSFILVYSLSSVCMHIRPHHCYVYFPP